MLAKPDNSEHVVQRSKAYSGAENPDEKPKHSFPKKNKMFKKEQNGNEFGINALKKPIGFLKPDRFDRHFFVDKILTTSTLKFLIFEEPLLF